jgi:hypothetical protein
MQPSHTPGAAAAAPTVVQEQAAGSTCESENNAASANNQAAMIELHVCENKLRTDMHTHNKLHHTPLPNQKQGAAKTVQQQVRATLLRAHMST